MLRKDIKWPPLCCTGLHVNTHNLDKLLRYCSMLNDTIPRNTAPHNEQQAHIFQLLQKAYIDTRYKDDYKISNAELEHIKAMLVKLVEII